MQIKRKKRRTNNGPSKNELRSLRNERQDQERLRSGNLRQRFPQISKLSLDYRQQSNAGVTLEHISREIKLDETLMLDIVCQGACDGRFNLLPLLEQSVEMASEQREGKGICQSPSYLDPRVVCGTTLLYRFIIGYNEAPAESE